MLKKVLAVNLLLFAVYAFLISQGSAYSTRGFNIAIGMGFCVFFQVLVNVVLGIGAFIMNRREPGRSFLVSAAVLVPVGFIVWLVLLSIYGGK